MGPRAGLDTEDRGKIPCPCRGSNPDRPVRSMWTQFIGLIADHCPAVVHGDTVKESLMNVEEIA